MYIAQSISTKTVHQLSPLLDPSLVQQFILCPCANGLDDFLPFFPGFGILYFQQSQLTCFPIEQWVIIELGIYGLAINRQYYVASFDP